MLIDHVTHNTTLALKGKKNHAARAALSHKLDKRHFVLIAHLEQLVEWQNVVGQSFVLSCIFFHIAVVNS